MAFACLQRPVALLTGPVSTDEVLGGYAWTAWNCAEVQHLTRCCLYQALSQFGRRSWRNVSIHVAEHGVPEAAATEEEVGST